MGPVFGGWFPGGEVDNSVLHLDTMTHQLALDRILALCLGHIYNSHLILSHSSYGYPLSGGASKFFGIASSPFLYWFLQAMNQEMTLPSPSRGLHMSRTLN